MFIILGANHEKRTFTTRGSRYGAGTSYTLNRCDTEIVKPFDGKKRSRKLKIIHIHCNFVVRCGKFSSAHRDAVAEIAKRKHESVRNTRIVGELAA